ncbi:MAG: tetratricopeptide repeat protein, partial [Pseudomonadota bacterium]
PASQGAALVQASGGRVSPGAMAAFDAALALNPREPRALYFRALGALQNGDPQTAIASALALNADLPVDAPLRPALASIVDAARAALLEADDRSAQIDAMVDGLAARLEAEGGTLEEWLRLGRSELVRGRPDAAAAAYREALRIAPDDATAQTGLARAEASRNPTLE